jgi:hypothetical protein
MIYSGIYDSRTYLVNTSLVVDFTRFDRIPCIYAISGIYRPIGGEQASLLIGSTKNAHRRIIREHLCDLKGNRHPNPHIQRAFNLEGVGSYKFIILEKATENDKNFLLEREQNWIDYYFDNFGKKSLFNCNELAHYPTLSKELIRKIADKKCKKWIITKPTGEEIIITNLEKFSREHGLWAQNMRKVALGKLRHTHGYMCRFIEDKNQKYKYNREKSKELILKQSFDWLVTSPSGEELKIKNLKQFARDNGLCTNACYRVGNGYISHLKGWKIKKITKSDPKRFTAKKIDISPERREAMARIKSKNFLVYFPNGEVKKIFNLTKFCRENGLIPSCMLGVASRKRKVHKGFRVERLE